MKKGTLFLSAVCLIVASVAMGQETRRTTTIDEASRPQVITDPTTLEMLTRSISMMTTTVADVPALPQAPAVVSVITSPDWWNREGSRIELLYRPDFSGYLILRVTLPNGENFLLSSYRVEKITGRWTSMELWGGRFPSSWQTGHTRFEVFFLTDYGETSFVSATVPVKILYQSVLPTGGVKFSPEDQTIFVEGIFTDRAVYAVDMLYQGVATATAGGVKLSLPPEDARFYKEGEHVFTLCDRGVCATRSFFFSFGGKG